MKLLLCSGCHDVVALQMDEKRTCKAVWTVLGAKLPGSELPTP
jgi:hypothetical protein